MLYADSDIITNYNFNTDPSNLPNTVLTVNRVGGSGGSKLADALNLIRTSIFSTQSVFYDRQGVPNYIVALIDSQSLNSAAVSQAAQLLRNDGVTILPIGISSSNPQPYESEISSLAMQPPQNNGNYWYINVNDLNNYRQVIGNLVCTRQQVTPLVPGN